MTAHRDTDQVAPDLITVVVTYNGMPWLDRCLGSLRASTMPTRVVVVDNGSADGTPEHIARAFPGVALIRTGRNLGFGQGNNRGIKEAMSQGARHVFLLNQDAWVLPDTLGTLVARAEADDRFGVLSPMHRNGAGDALDPAFSRYVAPGRCPDLYSDLLHGRAAGRVYPAAFINAAAWLVSARCLRTVGGFSPLFFHYGEDDEYVQRMRHHGSAIGVVPDAWVHHDRGGAGPREDADAVFLRKTLLRYADPAQAARLSAERFHHFRSAVGAGLVMDRAGARDAWHRYKLLGTLDRTAIASHRRAVGTPGPAFLQDPAAGPQ